MPGASQGVGRPAAQGQTLGDGAGAAGQPRSELGPGGPAWQPPGRKQSLGGAASLPQAQGQAGAEPGPMSKSPSLLVPLGGWSSAAPDAAAPAFSLVPECGELQRAPAAGGSSVHTPACPTHTPLPHPHAHTRPPRAHIYLPRTLTCPPQEPAASAGRRVGGCG